MTNQEREFIIEKREECKHMVNAAANNAIISAIIGISCTLASIFSGNMEAIAPNIYAEGLFFGGGLVSGIATCVQNFTRLKFEKIVDNYDKLLNGLETEQNQEVEKEGKSR